MINKRVLVNFFNTSARDKAREKLQNRSESDSFMIGEIDENNILDLQKQQGIIVEPLDRDPKIVKSFRMAEPESNLNLISSNNNNFISETIDQTKPNFYL